MDLTRYKGKTVEKWTALIPAASRGDVSSYGVLLVYRKKAVGAYLLEKPSGVVTGLKDAQTAMALQEAEQVSGEDFSGDWGERHDEELTDEQARQTSGEDFSGDWGERHDEELTSEQAQQTSGEPENAQSQPVQYTDLPLDAEATPSNRCHFARKNAVKQKRCAIVVFLENILFNVTKIFDKNRQYGRVKKERLRFIIEIDIQQPEGSSAVSRWAG